ncbi:hypothetical protein AWC01_04400 [Mycobacterium doricum]|uniref:Uncharacterized protein n=1 Tax=Mycolicibacterium doricum TaxID=126673 RepID=A0A1X1TIT6_9MYCO|nr:hypothetical protein AWC01_04400 [Mycolicibacterium doricum]
MPIALMPIAAPVAHGARPPRVHAVGRTSTAASLPEPVDATVRLRRAPRLTSGAAPVVGYTDHAGVVHPRVI